MKTALNARAGTAFFYSFGYKKPATSAPAQLSVALRNPTAGMPARANPLILRQFVICRSSPALFARSLPPRSGTHWHALQSLWQRINCLASAVRHGHYDATTAH